MISQRISQRCLTRTSTNSTLIWCLSQLICTRLLALNTSRSRSFRPSLRRQCHSCKRLSFCPISRTYRLPPWTCSISTSSLPLRKSRWPSSLTSATTRTLSTTFASVVTSWVSLRTWRTLMIPKPSCTIYFRKSSSTSAQTFLEPSRTTTTRTHEAETARATCRWRRLRMARLKILILISLKSMRFEQAFELPFT